LTGISAAPAAGTLKARHVTTVAAIAALRIDTPHTLTDESQLRRENAANCLSFT